MQNFETHVFETQLRYGTSCIYVCFRISISSTISLLQILCYTDCLRDLLEVRDINILVFIFTKIMIYLVIFHFKQHLCRPEDTFLRSSDSK